MITLTLYNGETRHMPKGSTLLPLAEEFAKDFATPIVEGIFNGETIDLQASLQEDGTVRLVRKPAISQYAKMNGLRYVTNVNTNVPTAPIFNFHR